MARKKSRVVGRRTRTILTEANKEIVWAKSDGRCWYCGEVVSKEATYLKRPNVDHVYPFCKGGPDDIGNLVLACFGCNAEKRGQTVEEYRQSIGSERAWWFENTAEDILKVRTIWGSELASALFVGLLDMAALCRRANFLFFGEMTQDQRAAALLSRPFESDYVI